jgi:hypothetical protein
MSTPYYKPTAPLTVSESNGIRTFDDANIQRAVDRALAELPADRKFAIVAHADLTGASLSALVKLGSDWSVAVGCYKPYAGAFKAEADIRWSPF